jgi:hypothetical protein
MMVVRWELTLLTNRIYVELGSAELTRDSDGFRQLMADISSKRTDISDRISMGTLYAYIV